MPGGEGSDSSINSLTNVNNNESRLPTASESVINNDSLCADDCGDNAMTLGDGVRRRKVIRAAKETLDKGKKFLIRFFF